jgi:hypothetical protein
MDLLELQLTEVDGKSRVLLRFQSAQEVAEIERRIDEERAKKKEKEADGSVVPNSLRARGRQASSPARRNLTFDPFLVVSKHARCRA